MVFSLALEWKREEVLALIALKALAHAKIAAHARFLSDVILYTELYQCCQRKFIEIPRLRTEINQEVITKGYQI